MAHTKVAHTVTPFTKNTLPDPSAFPIERGEGVYFWDTSGKRYIDFSSQTLNLLLGQCHPVVVDAIEKQIRTLSFGSSRFGTVPYFDAVEKLVGIAPKGLTKANLKMCNGSDANETAVKTAKKYTGKTGIISFNNGHTGQSTQTIHLRGYARGPEILAGSKEDVVFVDPPRCKEPQDYKETITQIARQIEAHGNIAGILVDPIMVNAGVLVTSDTKHYLQEIENLAKRHGIVFILDECQSFGWMPDLFAAAYYGIEPGIITLGKGLAAGHPLSGVLIQEQFDVLDYNEADFTHGGHALCCAIASAVLSFLKEEDHQIQSKEQLIAQRLAKLRDKSSFNLQTRGVGMIHVIDFELSSDGEAMAQFVFQETLRQGLFLRKYRNKLVLKPPIIITHDQINEAFTILHSVLSIV